MAFLCLFCWHVLDWNGVLLISWHQNKENLVSSDGSGLGPGLKARPARPIFARPGPPEARSKKPESPGAFFGPKIGRFSTDFRPNLGKIMGHFVTKNFSFVFGHFWPKIGPFLTHFRPNFGLVQSLKILTRKNSDFIHIKQKNRCILYFGKARKKARSPM